MAGFQCQATLERQQYRGALASWRSPLSPQKQEHSHNWYILHWNEES